MPRVRRWLRLPARVSFDICVTTGVRPSLDAHVPHWAPLRAAYEIRDVLVGLLGAPVDASRIHGIGSSHRHRRLCFPKHGKRPSEAAAEPKRVKRGQK